MYDFMEIVHRRSGIGFVGLAKIQEPSHADKKQ